MRGREVRFFPGHVALVVQCPGNAGAVSGLAEHSQALVVKRGGPRIVALQLHYVGEIAEGTGKVSGIADVLPDRDTSLEQQGCSGEFATIASIDGQRVQCDGNAAIVVEFEQMSRLSSNSCCAGP